MKKTDFAALFVLLLAVAAMTWPLVAGDRVLFPFHTGTLEPWKSSAPEWVNDEPANYNVGDKHAIIYPDLTFSLSELRSGHLPLWNPHQFAGLPHQANPLTATTYPPNAIFGWFDPLRGFGISCVFHLLLAALFTYLFLRSITIGPGCALLGGLAFALSGWMAVHVQHQYFVHTMTWLPLMLFSVERLLRQGTRWTLLTLAIGIAMSLLAGFYQTAIINLYLVAAYTVVGLIVLARRHAPRIAVRTGGMILLFVLLGIGLGSVQFIPTAAFAVDAGRDDLEAAQLEADTLRPVTLIHLVMPDFFGNPQVHRTASECLFAHWLLDAAPGTHLSNNYSERTFYPGTLVLVLALICLFLRRDRAVVTIAAAGLVGLLLALGTPLMRVLPWLPGLDIGSPMRFTQLTAFAFPVLFAAAFGRLLRVAAVPRPKLFRFVTVSGAMVLFPLVVAVLTLWITPTWATERFTDWLVERGVDQRLGYGDLDIARKYDGMKPHVEFLRHNLTLGLLTLLGALLVVATWARGRIAPRYVFLATLLFVVGELTWFGVRFNRPVRHDGMYATTPGIEFLQADGGRANTRFVRFGSGNETSFFSPNAPMVYGLHDAQGFRALAPETYLDFMRTVEPNPYDVGLPNLNDLASLSAPQLALLRVGHAIAPGPVANMPWTRVYPPNDAPAADFHVYRNPNLVPRAFFVSQVNVMPENDMATEFRAMRAAPAEVNPFRDQVWLAELRPGMRTQYVPAGDDAVPNVVEDRAGYLDIAVSNPNDGLLMVTEQYDRGWKASAFDAGGGRRPLTILRADMTFMAVAVPKGTTRVQLRYEPTSFKWGGLVTGIAVVILLLVPLLPTLREPGPTLTAPHDDGPTWNVPSSTVAPVDTISAATTTSNSSDSSSSSSDAPLGSSSPQSPTSGDA